MVWTSNNFKYDMVNLPRESNYKVCIECFAYNQKEYIKDMLEGILMQKTDFPFYALVIDDASTDGTREIIEEYCRRYPDRFSALLAYENIFGKKESYDIYRDTLFTYTNNSVYVATCEGDDYWIDKEKLWIQVEYMDNHPDCMMYLHNSHLVDCRTGEIKSADPFECEEEKDLEMSELILIKNGHPATASRLYRQEMIFAPKYVTDCSVGDYPMMLYCASQGCVHYSDRIMCDYRFISKGSTTEIMQADIGYRLYHRLGVLIFLLQFDEQTEYKYHEYISEASNPYAEDIIGMAGNGNKIDEYWRTNKGKYSLINEYKWVNFFDKYRRQLFDEDYLHEDALNQILKFEKIIIMGTGFYSQILRKKLKGAGCKINGFARTVVDNDEDRYEGYPLWQLDRIPYERDEFLLLIGIRPKRDDRIFKSLRENEIKHYLNPFDISELYMNRRNICHE